MRTLQLIALLAEFPFSFVFDASAAAASAFKRACLLANGELASSLDDAVDFFSFADVSVAVLSFLATEFAEVEALLMLSDEAGDGVLLVGADNADFDAADDGVFLLV